MLSFKYNCKDTYLVVMHMFYFHKKNVPITYFG